MVVKPIREQIVNLFAHLFLDKIRLIFDIEYEQQADKCSDRLRAVGAMMAIALGYNPAAMDYNLKGISKLVKKILNSESPDFKKFEKADIGTLNAKYSGQNRVTMFIGNNGETLLATRNVYGLEKHALKTGLGKMDKNGHVVERESFLEEEFHDETIYKQFHAPDLGMGKPDNVNAIKLFHVDYRDYDLQNANGLERPIYLEPYKPVQSDCFAVPNLTSTLDRVSSNGELLKYVNEVMQSITPYTPYHLHAQSVEYLRYTPRHMNMCINPLQAIRAWALLANMADGKTNTDLLNFVGKYTYPGQLENNKMMNDDILNLHFEAEKLFEGCVRVFTELPKHLWHNEDIRIIQNSYYGGKSLRGAMQHHCFATDPDGLYSCHRINEEVALSTHGAVNFVVPENHAPNWRASIALVSAMDCTFYWKTYAKPKLMDNFNFVNEQYGASKCVGYFAHADFKFFEDIYCLESRIPGVRLYITFESPDKMDSKKEFMSKLHEKIQTCGDWHTTFDSPVFLPLCTTSTPLSLYAHAKASGLSRIFSSEKSELLEMKSIPARGGARQFSTLYDHYHKTVFEVHGSDPKVENFMRKRPRRMFDQFSPARAHQCVDDSMAELHGKYQMKNPTKEFNNKMNINPLLTYRENHLNHDEPSFEWLHENHEFDLKDPKALMFNKPFYYVMTRALVGKNQLIVCAGYFNNTTWVKQQ